MRCIRSVFRAWVLALAAILALSCSARRETVLYVGMAMDDAVEELRHSGAREEALAAAPPPGGFIRSFLVDGGRLISVISDRVEDAKGGKVIEIEVCDEPGKPKDFQEWKKVREITIGR